MAGQKIDDIRVGLGLDLASIRNDAASAHKALQSLTTGKNQSRTIKVVLKAEISDAGIKTGLETIGNRFRRATETWRKEGALTISPKFTVSPQSVGGLRIAINKELKNLARGSAGTPGQAVNVPIKMNPSAADLAAAFTKLQAQVTASGRAIKIPIVFTQQGPSGSAGGSAGGSSSGGGGASRPPRSPRSPSSGGGNTGPAGGGGTTGSRPAGSSPGGSAGGSTPPPSGGTTPPPSGGSTSSGGTRASGGTRSSGTRSTGAASGQTGTTGSSAPPPPNNPPPPPPAASTTVGSQPVTEPAADERPRPFQKKIRNFIGLERQAEAQRERAEAAGDDDRWKAADAKVGRSGSIRTARRAFVSKQWGARQARRQVPIARAARLRGNRARQGMEGLGPQGNNVSGTRSTAANPGQETRVGIDSPSGTHTPSGLGPAAIHLGERAPKTRGVRAGRSTAGMTVMNQEEADRINASLFSPEAIAFREQQRREFEGMLQTTRQNEALGRSDDPEFQMVQDALRGVKWDEGGVPDTSSLKAIDPRLHYAVRAFLLGDKDVMKTNISDMFKDLQGVGEIFGEPGHGPATKKTRKDLAKARGTRGRRGVDRINPETGESEMMSPRYLVMDAFAAALSRGARAWTNQMTGVEGSAGPRKAGIGKKQTEAQVPGYTNPETGQYRTQTYADYLKNIRRAKSFMPQFGGGKPLEPDELETSRNSMFRGFFGKAGGGFIGLRQMEDGGHTSWAYRNQRDRMRMAGWSDEDIHGVLGKGQPATYGGHNPGIPDSLTRTWMERVRLAKKGQDWMKADGGFAPFATNDQGRIDNIMGNVMGYSGLGNNAIISALGSWVPPDFGYEQMGPMSGMAAPMELPKLKHAMEGLHVFRGGEIPTRYQGGENFLRKQSGYGHRTSYVTPSKQYAELYAYQRGVSGFGSAEGERRLALKAARRTARGMVFEGSVPASRIASLEDVERLAPHAVSQGLSRFSRGIHPNAAGDVESALSQHGYAGYRTSTDGLEMSVFNPQYLVNRLAGPKGPLPRAGGGFAPRQAAHGWAAGHLPDNAGHPAATLVGERGPEVFIPESSGWIIPNHLMHMLPKRAEGGPTTGGWRQDGPHLQGVLGLPNADSRPFKKVPKTPPNTRSWASNRWQVAGPSLDQIEHGEAEPMTLPWRGPKGGRGFRPDFAGQLGGPGFATQQFPIQGPGFVMNAVTPPSVVPNPRYGPPGPGQFKLGNNAANGPVPVNVTNAQQLGQNIAQNIANAAPPLPGANTIIGQNTPGGTGGPQFGGGLGKANQYQKTLARQQGVSSVDELRNRLDKVGADISEQLSLTPVRALSVSLGQLAQQLVGGRAGIQERARTASGSRGRANREVGELERREGMLAEKQFAKRDLDQNVGQLSPNDLQAAKALNDQEVAAAEAAVKAQRPFAEAATAKAEADTKKISTPLQRVKSQALGVTGIVAGTLLFTGAMKLAQAAVMGLGMVTKNAVEEMTNFAGTMTRVTSGLSDSIQGRGQLSNSTLAQQFATTGISSSLLGPLRDIVTKQAGAKNYIAQSDLLRANRNITGRDTSLVGTFQGFGNGPLAGIPGLGGILQDQGVVERFVGDLKTVPTPGTVQNTVNNGAAGAVGPATGDAIGDAIRSARLGVNFIGNLVSGGTDNAGVNGLGVLQGAVGNGLKDVGRNGFLGPLSPIAGMLGDFIGGDAGITSNGPMGGMSAVDTQKLLIKRSQEEARAANAPGVLNTNTQATKGGYKGSITVLTDAEQSQQQAALKEIGPAAEGLAAAMKSLGMGLKNADGSMPSANQIKAYWEAVDRGANLPSMEEVLGAITPQLTAQARSVNRNLQFQNSTAIPANFAAQYLAAPATYSGRLGTQGIVAQNASAADQGIAGQYSGQINSVRGQLASMAADGQKVLKDVLGATGMSPQEIDAQIQGVSDLGESITRLQDKASEKSLALDTIQYNRQLFLAKRNIGDLIGLQGKSTEAVGGQLMAATQYGKLQRQQIEDERTLSTIQLARSRREIQFQLALSRLSTPGSTPEERATRRAEGEYQAKEAMRMQQISERTTKRGFKIQDIGISREARDAIVELGIMQKSHGLQVELRGIEQLTQAKQQLLSVKQAYLDTSKEAGITLKHLAIDAQDQIEQATGDFSGKFEDEVRTSMDTIVKEAKRAYKNFLADTGIDPTAGTDNKDTTDSTGGNPKGGTSIKPSAAGYYGVTAGTTRFTAGEAGQEHVLILRNPKQGMMDLGGGRSSGGLPVAFSNTFNISANGASPGDLNEVVRAVKRAIHEEAAMLGFMPRG